MLEKGYRKRFDRNIGILTEEEQNKLNDSTVAIAGIGGVGGIPAERLARLGIGHLKIADPETFTDTDLNRQFGSSIKTLGKKKVEIVGEILKGINPELQLETFPEGINKNNVNGFLNGTDIIIDAVEFFVLKERLLLYSKARERGIYIILSGAPGFGSPLFVFSPDGMTMEEFFGLPSNDKLIENFQISAENFYKLFPKSSEYLPPELMRDSLNRERPFSALSPTCSLAGSLLSAEAIIILLNKRNPVVVPEYIMLDLFKQKLVKMNSS